LSISAPFSFLAPACIVLHTLKKQGFAVLAYRFSPMLCKALQACAAGKKAGKSESAIFFPLWGLLDFRCELTESV